MTPKWKVKKWRTSLWAPWAAKGVSKEPQRHQRSPRAPKMEPKRAPRPPKWIPRGAQRPQNNAQANPPSTQNGAQEASRTGCRNVRKKPPRSYEHTDRRKDNNPTTHHANNPKETARRNARSDPPPHWGRCARPHSRGPSPSPVSWPRSSARILCRNLLSHPSIIEDALRATHRRPASLFEFGLLWQSFFGNV